jgi:hypothetical protein
MYNNQNLNTFEYKDLFHNEGIHHDIKITFPSYINWFGYSMQRFKKANR